MSNLKPEISNGIFKTQDNTIYEHCIKYRNLPVWKLDEIMLIYVVKHKRP